MQITKVIYPQYFINKNCTISRTHEGNLTQKDFPLFFLYEEATVIVITNRIISIIVAQDTKWRKRYSNCSGDRLSIGSYANLNNKCKTRFIYCMED